MSMEDRVAKMKKIEYASPEELPKLIQFDRQEQKKDGTLINHYIVPDGRRAPGYLWINYEPETMNVLSAEMNVNFDNLIGLNRSPIELRLLCNHVLAHLPMVKPEAAEE